MKWRFVDAAAALLYGVSTSVLAALGLAFISGGLRPVPAGIALGLGLLVAAGSFWCATLRRQQDDGPTPRLESAASNYPAGFEWAAVLMFALASARAFLWLIFQEGDHLRVLSPNNLGDISLHLTYIRNLASGVAFWPDNPILAHSKLTYPLGIDLLNALLALAGVDVQRGLIWVGLLGAAVTGLALWRWGRGIALIAFLANGGLAGFAFFWSGKFVDFQTDLAWKNFFLSIFVTQRGMLFALPTGLLLLASWRARFFEAARRQEVLPFLGELLLYAALPLFHLHTFLFLSLMLGSWYLFHPPARRAILRLVSAAFLPATTLVMLITGMMHGASVLGWKPGWMFDDESWLKWCASHLPGPPEFSALFFFWPVNLGFLLPLVGWLAWRLLHGRRVVRQGRDVAANGSAPESQTPPPAVSAESGSTWACALFFPALGIFVLCCFVKFAPWEWDNTKIMIWSYLAIVPLAWCELLQQRLLWQRGVALWVLFWSGFASLIGGIDGKFQGFELATRSQLDGVAKAVAMISPTERFAAFPTYNHPLLLLGRKLALGYPGHVRSHGLAWETPQQQVESLLNGVPEWRSLAAILDVHYLFWGNEEGEHYPDSKQPWIESCRLIASGDWGDLYDLRRPPQEPAQTEKPPTAP